MKIFRNTLWSIFTLVLLGIVIVTRAQDSCPANVLLPLSRAGAVCLNNGASNACYGNGAAEMTFQPGTPTDARFTQPGDRVHVRYVHALSIGAPDAEFSVVTLQTPANLVETQQGRGLTILMFGDVDIVNTVTPVPTVLVSASGTVNIRTHPLPDADIIERIPLRGNLVAHGRTQNSQWLRVTVPETMILGWVSVDVLADDVDFNILNIVDETTPYRQPFETFTVRTGVDDAWCDGMTESGILLQTPNASSIVEVDVNGVFLRFSTTAHIQAQPGGLMTITVLEGSGEIEVAGTRYFIPTGARIQLPLDEAGIVSGAPNPTEPYVAAEIAALPLNNLAVRFVIAPPLTNEQIASLTEAWAAPTPTPLPADAGTPTPRCIYTVRRTTNTWGGPGTFYEIVNELTIGTRVYPVLQIVDANAVVWLQLYDSNWVQAAAVEAEGNCSPIPETDIIQYPRTNYLSLETCETTNGPLRAGQRVYIEFVPPGWDTLAEARQAVNVDPGHVLIDDQPLYVRASNPIQVAEERYIVRFGTVWIATEGSHRIEGGRAFYTLICNLTVPVG